MSEENVKVYESSIDSLSVPGGITLSEDNLLTVRLTGVLNGNVPILTTSGIAGGFTEDTLIQNIFGVLGSAIGVAQTARTIAATRATGAPDVLLAMSARERTPGGGTGDATSVQFSGYLASAAPTVSRTNMGVALGAVGEDAVLDGFNAACYQAVPLEHRELILRTEQTTFSGIIAEAMGDLTSAENVIVATEVIDAATAAAAAALNLSNQPALAKFYEIIRNMEVGNWDALIGTPRINKDQIKTYYVKLIETTVNSGLFATLRAIANSLNMKYVPDFQLTGALRTVDVMVSEDARDINLDMDSLGFSTNIGGAAAPTGVCCVATNIEGWRDVFPPGSQAPLAGVNSVVIGNHPETTPGAFTVQIPPPPWFTYEMLLEASAESAAGGGGGSPGLSDREGTERKAKRDELVAQQKEDSQAMRNLLNYWCELQWYDVVASSTTSTLSGLAPEFSVQPGERIRVVLNTPFGDLPLYTGLVKTVTHEINSNGQGQVIPSSQMTLGYLNAT